MKELKVGEKLHTPWGHQFYLLQITEVPNGDYQRKCNDCFYRGRFLKTGCLAPPCMDYERSDHKNIIYKEINE